MSGLDRDQGQKQENLPTSLSFKYALLYQQILA